MKIDDLVRKQGRPRSTLEEHIRKAESKIVLAQRALHDDVRKGPRESFHEQDESCRGNRRRKNDETGCYATSREKPEAIAQS